MLVTKYVFIDTQIYVASNFDYRGGRLRRFADLARAGKVLPITTDLTVREILSNIEERVGIATGVLQRLRDKGRILENASTPSFANVFGDYNQAAVIADLSKQLDVYHDDGEFRRLSIDPRITPTVLDSYFAKRPPFGLEKKKSEFPDAFVVETLRAFCRSEGTQLYIVSGDSDMQSVCGGDTPFISLESLEQVFELIAKEDEALVEIAHDLVWDLVTEIDDRLARLFTDLGFYLKNQDGDVRWVSVERVMDHDFHILELEDENAYFGMTATIQYTAQVTYDEATRSIYDYEDGPMYAWEPVEKRISREAMISAYGSFSFEPREPHEPVLDDLSLETGSSVGIEVHIWGA